MKIRTIKSRTKIEKLSSFFSKKKEEGGKEKNRQNYEKDKTPRQKQIMIINCQKKKKEYMKRNL